MGVETAELQDFTLNSKDECGEILRDEGRWDNEYGDDGLRVENGASNGIDGKRDCDEAPAEAVDGQGNHGLGDDGDDDDNEDDSDEVDDNVSIDDVDDIDIENDGDGDCDGDDLVLMRRERSSSSFISSLSRRSMMSSTERQVLSCRP